MLPVKRAMLGTSRALLGNNRPAVKEGMENKTQASPPPRSWFGVSICGGSSKGAGCLEARARTSREVYASIHVSTMQMTDGADWNLNQQAILVMSWDLSW